MPEWFCPPKPCLAMLGDFGDWMPAHILAEEPGRYLVSFDAGEGHTFLRYLREQQVKLDPSSATTQEAGDTKYSGGPA